MKRASRDSERYIVDVQRRLQKMLIERGFGVEVNGRVKHLYSIHRKMRRQNIDFDQVHDFVAFRVMMETVSDCYAALGVVHSQWTPIPGRFKDVRPPSREAVTVAECLEEVVVLLKNNAALSAIDVSLYRQARTR